MSLSYAQNTQCRAHRPRPVYRPPDYNRPTCVYWNVLMETMKNAENPWQELVTFRRFVAASKGIPNPAQHFAFTVNHFYPRAKMEWTQGVSLTHCKPLNH